jgi:exodeoxyribonuclease VII large subunit
MQRLEDRMQSKEQMLRLLGPDSVLARGFSYTTDAKGRVITDADTVESGDELVTRFSKGTVRSTMK